MLDWLFEKRPPSLAQQLRDSTPSASVAIAERFRDLAAPDLPLVDIEDHVDIDAGEARLSFKLDGTDYQWAWGADAAGESHRSIEQVLERLARLPSVGSKVAGVGREDAARAEFFRQDDQGSVRQVHR